MAKSRTRIGGHHGQVRVFFSEGAIDFTKSLASPDELHTSFQSRCPALQAGPPLAVALKDMETKKGRLFSLIGHELLRLD